MANNLTKGYMFEIPTNTTQVGEIMFGTPIQYTDGLFINIFLLGFFAMLTIGATAYQVTIDKALVYSTFATFSLTFLLSLAGYAGGNQLILSAVAFITVVSWKIMSSRGQGGIV